MSRTKQASIIAVFLGIGLLTQIPATAQRFHFRHHFADANLPGVDFLENVRSRTGQNETSGGKSIEVWYGHRQRFGHIGQPQPWINVLGGVTSPNTLASISMSLNGDAEMPLTIGSDKHRLARNGDFNAEIAWDDMKAGKNSLQLKAIWLDGTVEQADIELQVAREHRWPIPYRVDFRHVKRLQDVVQVVDGKWRLTDDGVRTDQPYYDRVLCVGDRNWKNYEATIGLTLHGFTPPKPGPPTYDVTHIGVALRWRGHTADGRQPSRRWYPLGAQGEFLVQPRSRGRWRILPNQKQRVYAEAGQRVELNQPLKIKAQVATIASGDTRYRFKLWVDGESEPTAWGAEHVEDGKDDFSSGSLCLVPHNTDVTYHEIQVEPISLDRH